MGRNAKPPATLAFKQWVVDALRRNTWREVCETYGISQSTLSEWKREVER